ncbi:MULTISPECIES: hypothetical protein [unclassified Rathayibacter]|uniref:hypothetical protein n=1 Tax=unclassified Rathayibacter TaxID=2609250 RepID=UPI000CE776AE|nr:MULTISPECIES: hypothetical protein [unclassified Rathayibacter]PPI39248.1 hypothetical protein C5D50_08780 [Rathayibacter sp. RFBD1]PPI57282.1 hypothetical protein C5D38_08360 [Rathayibacter sp. TRS19]
MWIGAGAGFALGGLLVGGIVAGIAASNEAKQDEASAAASTEAESKADAILATAFRACVRNPEGAELSDGDQTLTIDSEGEDDLAGLTYSELECILSATKAPQAVISHLEQTTSMDGRQSDEWDNLEMSWSYHPDRGTDGVLTVVD